MYSRHLDPRDEAVDKTTSARYDGAITAISKNCLVGWAWDKTRPDDPIEVELTVGKIRIASVIADRFEHALYEQNKGNGFHHFVATIETIGALPDDEVGDVAICMRVPETGEGFGEAFRIPARTLKALLLSKIVVGKIDGVDHGHVKGWIAGASNETAAPHLTVMIDGKALRTEFSLDPFIEHRGATVAGWRFSAAMPPSALNGHLHLITAHSGEYELPGSPLLFGPVPISNIVDAIAVQARSIADLDQRVSIIPSVQTTEGLLDLLAERTIDRVDMLMSIYRDNIERELGLMRNLLVTRIAETEVLPNPLLTVAAPNVAVSRTPRSRQHKTVFGENFSVSSGMVEVSEIGNARVGMLHDNVEIPLTEGAGRYLIVEGVCGETAADLMKWVFSIDGYPLLGRYELWVDGRWRFVGQSISPLAIDATSVLSIRPNNCYVNNEVELPILHILTIVSSGIVILNPDPEVPVSVGEHVAGNRNGFGWHKAETGSEASFRWMGQRAAIRANLKAGSTYELTLIGENSVPYNTEVDDVLALYVNKKQIQIRFRRTTHQFQRWVASAKFAIEAGGDNVLLEFVAAADIAKSPSTYEQSGDPRILSFSVRSLIIDKVQESE